jgi:hypothetical protein
MVEEECRVVVDERSVGKREARLAYSSKRGVFLRRLGRRNNRKRVGNGAFCLTAGVDETRELVAKDS